MLAQLRRLLEVRMFVAKNLFSDLQGCVKGSQSWRTSLAFSPAVGLSGGLVDGLLKDVEEYLLIDSL